MTYVFVPLRDYMKNSTRALAYLAENEIDIRLKRLLIKIYTSIWHGPVFESSG